LPNDFYTAAPSGATFKANGDVAISMKPLKTLSVSLLLLLIMTVLAGAGPAYAQSTTLYFHDNSELTFSYPPFQFQNLQISGIQANSSSTSARVFTAATTIAPSGGGLALSMSAMISVSSQPKVYAAFVAWVTNPFAANVTLDGNVTMQVWMSSSDVLLPWEGCEFFVGIANYSPGSSTPFQLLDHYLSNASIGYNALTTAPTEYVISTLRINQYKFHAGSRLMFFAGAGSNKRGYSFTVYFDSPSWQSRADIADASALPEYSGLGLVWITMFPVALLVIVRRTGIVYFDSRT